MESQVNVSMIRGLLQKMKSQQVSQAEAKMKQLTRNKSFLSIMLFIMSNNLEEQQIKTMAASFINSELFSNLNRDNSQIISQTLMMILSNPDVSNLNKRVFQKSIVKCLQKSTQVQKQRWGYFIQKCLNNVGFYDPAFFVITCIAAYGAQKKFLQKIIAQYYQITLNRIPVSAKNTKILIEMLKIWITIFDQLCQDKDSRQILQYMLNSQSLFKLISHIYELHSNQNTIICLQSGFEELNLLKWYAAQINKRMLQVQLKQLQDRQMKVGFIHIQNFTRLYLVRFVNTLIVMATMKSQFQHYSCEDLLISLLSISRLYLLLKPGQYTLQTAIKFQNLIVFPFLVISEAQMDKFQNSPEQFNLLAEDCSEKQTFGTVKSQAALLLETLGDKVPESCTYAIDRAIQSIKIRLGYEQSYSFKDQQVLEIQTAFTILSIFSYKFSYKLSNKVEQAQTICKILRDEKVKSLPALELSRIFIFLGYNYFEVFKDPNIGQDWLNFAINYKMHPTTRYCAFDCFSSIIQEYYHEDCMPRIGQEIEAGNLELARGIVCKIFKTHYNELSQNGIKLMISKLFRRIGIQLELIRLRKKADTQDIIKCLRIFHDFLKEIKNDVVQNISRNNFVISAVWPILDFYKEAIAFNIQDEVVIIAIQLINLMDTLNPQIFKHVAQCVRYIKAPKINYCEKNYFILFNQIIMKADFMRDWQELTKIMATLKDIVRNLLSNKLRDYQTKKLKKTPHFRLALCNVLIVIQNLISIFGTDIVKLGCSKIFQQISSLCIRLLPQTKNDIQKTSTGYIILSRALNTLFLCHMHMKIDSIYTYLQLLQNEKVYHGYDTKVLVICITKQIFQENDITDIVLLLTALSKIVQNSDMKNELLLNIQKSKNIKVINQLKKIQDFNRIITKIDSPFNNNQGISQLLTAMLVEMSRNNAELYNDVLKALPAKVLVYFNQLLQPKNEQKKKRTYFKVVDIKTINFGLKINTIEDQNSDQTINDEDSDQQQSKNRFKRTKTQLKIMRKNKKLVKLDQRGNNNKYNRL